jgi:hypothetical protein
LLLQLQALWGERERFMGREREMGGGGGGGEREIYWEMLHNRGSGASLAHTRADTGLSAHCDDSVKRDLLHCEKRPIIVCLKRQAPSARVIEEQ